MFAFVDGSSSDIKPFLHMMLHLQLENVRTIIFSTTYPHSKL